MSDADPDDSDDDFDDEFDESFEEAFDDGFEAVDSGSGSGVTVPSLRDLGEAVGEAVLDGIGRASARLQERRPLAADVLESDDAFLVVFDAPGAESEDVQVRYEDDVVAVRVDRFREFQEGFEMRVPGRGLSLSGRVALPSNGAVDVDATEATLTDDGTIRIRVPKLVATGPSPDEPAVEDPVDETIADPEDVDEETDVDVGEEATDDDLTPDDG